MEKSKFLTLGAKDFLRGLAQAAGTGAAVVLMPVLVKGQLPSLLVLKLAAAAAISAGGVYLFKNLLTNSADQFGKPEPKNIPG